jgi:putative transposase
VPGSPAGRPPQLTDAEKKRLVVVLEAGALVQGYATDLWTLSRVGKLIEKIGGKRYSEWGVCRLLKGLNFSCQRPSGRASSATNKPSAIGRRSGGRH